MGGLPEIGQARDRKFEISEKFDEFSRICRQGLILAPIQTLLYLHSHEHFIFFVFFSLFFEQELEQVMKFSYKDILVNRI